MSKNTTYIPYTLHLTKQITCKANYAMYATNETSKTPIFQINQHIGDDKDVIDSESGEVTKGDGLGIDGKIFANEVLSYNENPNVDKLIFYVNSQGGDVQQSLDMFNAISMCSKRTHSIITGFAFSCAGWIPMAADKIDMVEETGKWMCHMPYDPSDPATKSQFMDEVVDLISKTIASKSGRNGVAKKTQDEIKKLMKEKTYWSAERMHKEGLIDNIVNAKGKVVRMEKDPITLNKTELNYFYKEYQVAQNKFVAEDREIEKQIKSQIKNNRMPFPKVANRLNKIDKTKTKIGFDYADDMSEDDVVDAIARLENRLRANNDEMMDMENKEKESKKEKEAKDAENKTALDSAKKLAEDKAKEANDAMCSYNSMKEANDKLLSENKEMKEKEDARNQELKAADLKFRQERAKNLVEKLIDQRKVIATEDMTIDQVKEYLVNKATENYTDVNTQYAIAPVKITGARPQFKNGKEINFKSIQDMVAQNREKVLNSQYMLADGKVNTSNPYFTAKGN